MMRVALIVGHSPKAPGAVNQTFNETEYSFNSTLVPMVAKELHALDIQPLIFYRDDLSTLPREINNADVDVVLSFHANAYNKIASGTETLFYHTSRKGRVLAQKVQDSITGVLGLRDRGIIPITSEDRGGYLLQKTDAPAVLLETMFIDNDVDFTIADGEKKELAKNIALAVSEFFA